GSSSWCKLFLVFTRKEKQEPAPAERSERPQSKNPPILYERTQKVIGQVEEKLGERLITYWNSPSGSICSNDVIGLYGILRSMGRVERLSAVIKSRGGYGQGSLRLVDFLAPFAGKLPA